MKGKAELFELTKYGVKHVPSTLPSWWYRWLPQNYGVTLPAYGMSPGVCVRAAVQAKPAIRHMLKSFGSTTWTSSAKQY